MDNKKQSNPVFSGGIAELDDFVTEILKNLSLSELAYYADQKYAAHPIETESGYRLPETAQGGLDATAGIDTDLPIPLHIGNSWDRELAKKTGMETSVYERVGTEAGFSE